METVSVKWDGAPSIFAGIDPSDGVFFVAKKGIFNKSPKVYKSVADVDADTSGGLAAKLKTCSQVSSLSRHHRSCPKVIGCSVRMIYIMKPLKEKDYVAFHPNTIVYAVPVESGRSKSYHYSQAWYCVAHLIRRRLFFKPWKQPLALT